MKAVSATLFSSAIAWRVASSSQASSGTTPAWLPVNGRSAKASIWAKGSFMPNFP